MTTPARSRWALVAAAPGAVLLALPLAALAWRLPWTDLWHDLSSREARAAVRLSLVCSVWATAISVVLGLPLAWALARVPFRGRSLARAITLVPLVLPPVVGGVALLLAFGRRGVLGEHLDAWLGVRLPFTTAGAALAEAFVAMPFFVLASEAAFRAADRRYEDAARTLGARRRTVFLRVVLPLAWPGLAAGVVLAWARALGEFGATLTFAGNAPERTTTIPLEVYLLLESGRQGPALALSFVLVVISVAVLVVLRGRWWGGWAAA